MELFKGDALCFNYSCELSDGNLYEFNELDKLILVIYNKFKKDEYIEKQITINQPTKLFNILLNDELNKFEPGLYILEVKTIIDNQIYTTLHENLYIKESWVYNG